FEGKAERMLKDAAVLHKSLGNEEALAFTYRQLAELFDRRGNPRQTEAALKDAQVLHKKLGSEQTLALLYFSLGHNRSKRGDKAQACAYWHKGALAYPNERRLVEALNNNKCAASR